MKAIGIAVLLVASMPASGIAAGSTSDSAKRQECERLISILEHKSATGAYESLEKMRVFRKGNHYQACIDTAHASQVR